MGRRHPALHGASRVRQANQHAPQALGDDRRGHARGGPGEESPTALPRSATLPRRTELTCFIHERTRTLAWPAPRPGAVPAGALVRMVDGRHLYDDRAEPEATGTAEGGNPDGLPRCVLC